jgi:LuxR family maltose regulon positive regulatory protein
VPHPDRGPTPVPLVASKLRPFEVPKDLVPRRRVEDAIEHGGTVVLVTAPPGYGKTTAVAGWAARTDPARLAWVSLDALDRNALSLWRHVIAAIAAVCPAAAEAEALLLDHGAADPSVVAALLEALLQEPVPVVLVLDDLHVVDDPAVGDQLALLVERAVGRLRLVATSRTETLLPIGRWRTEGLVTELREEDLAFRPEEAGSLLARFDGVQLDAVGVERLTDRTEGWAVGLLLSGILLDRDPDAEVRLEAILASDRLLADYLVSEMLDRLPDDLRRLALDLAVLPDFDQDAVVGLAGADAVTLLRQILRANPFITSWHTGGTVTYRFHPLIREFLLAELRWTDPARWEALHRRGASLFVDRGRIDVALSLLLTIGDVATAFDLVVTPVLAIADRGGLTQYARWFEQLPPLQPEDPVRAVDYALSLMYAGRLNEATDWCGHAEAMLQRAPDARSQRRLHLVRLLSVGAVGDYRRAAEEIEPFLALPSDDPAEIERRFAGQAARVALALDDLDAAARWVGELRDAPGRVLQEVLGPALEAGLLLARGKPSTALPLAAQATAAAERLAMRPHHAAFDAILYLAEAQIALARASDARETLEAAAEDSVTLAAPWSRVRTSIALTSLLALTDGWPQALTAVVAARESHGVSARGVLRERLAEAEARALLGCGRAEAATELIGTLSSGPRRSLLEARAAVVGGRPSEVADLLAGSSTWEVPARVEALILTSLAESGEAAEAALREALRLAAPGGLLAPFLAEGASLERTLRRLPVASLHPALAALRAAPSPAPVRPRAVEPLTARERDVLGLLPTHLSYAGIGERLYISVNTVKTNIRALYRKLGATDRSSAVEQARLAGLLAESSAADPLAGGRIQR